VVVFLMKAAILIISRKVGSGSKLVLAVAARTLTYKLDSLVGLPPRYGLEGADVSDPISGDLSAYTVKHAVIS